MFVLGNKQATLFVAQRGYGITGVLGGAEFFSSPDEARALAVSLDLTHLHVIPVELNLKPGWIVASEAVDDGGPPDWDGPYGEGPQ